MASVVTLVLRDEYRVLVCSFVIRLRGSTRNEARRSTPILARAPPRRPLVIPERGKGMGIPRGVDFKPLVLTANYARVRGVPFSIRPHPFRFPSAVGADTILVSVDGSRAAWASPGFRA